MKSRTSFFNATVLKKDITRFAPVWILFAVYLLFIIISETTGYALSSGYYEENYLPYIFSSLGGGSSLVMGFACATLLYGDLFKTRLCYGLHAMPLRRETWFATHFLSGTLFFVVPVTLAAGIMATILTEYRFIPALWWVAQVGSFFFYFTLAVFCVMCAGNRLGHAASFSMIALLPAIIYGVYSYMYEPMLYGILTDGILMESVTPVVLQMTGNYFIWDSTHFATGYTYQGIYPKAWIVLGCWVVVGAALWLITLRMYKRRKLEWAGDFVNYNWLKMVILILGSYLGAMILSVPGFVIGFFGITMLMERRVKVFHKKTWIRFGVLSAAVLVSLGLTWWDPVGITTYVPEPDKVESIGVGYEGGTGYGLLKDAESIQAAMDLHRYALEEQGPEDPEEDLYGYRLTYHLKSGREIFRIYTVNTNSDQVQALKMRLSSFEVLFGTADAEGFFDSVYSIQVNVNDKKQVMTPLYEWEKVPEEQFEAVFAALLEDCESGVLSQDHSFHPYSKGNFDVLRLWYKGEEGLTSVEVRVYLGSRTYSLFG